VTGAILKIIQTGRRSMQALFWERGRRGPEQPPRGDWFVLSKAS